MRFNYSRKLTKSEKILWTLMRVVMFARGYFLREVLVPSYSNFDIDGMPMNMARHNRRAGTKKICWVKRTVSFEKKIKELPYQISANW